jgi:hypothetical protein
VTEPAGTSWGGLKSGLNESPKKNIRNIGNFDLEDRENLESASRTSEDRSVETRVDHCLTPHMMCLDTLALEVAPPDLVLKIVTVTRTCHPSV